MWYIVLFVSAFMSTSLLFTIALCRAAARGDTQMNPMVVTYSCTSEQPAPATPDPTTVWLSDGSTRTDDSTPPLAFNRHIASMPQRLAPPTGQHPYGT